MLFTIDEATINGLAMPVVGGLRSPLHTVNPHIYALAQSFPCVAMGVWEVVRLSGVRDSDSAKDPLERFKHCCEAAVRKYQDEQLDEFAPLLTLACELRERIRAIAGTEPPVHDRIVTVTFHGLEWLVRHPMWWHQELSRTEKRSLADAACAALLRIYTSSQPNWLKILSGCEFVATQAGGHLGITKSNCANTK